MLPIVQVDRGAIKFILGGANIMCPGLTSAGGKMDSPLEEGDICVSLIVRVEVILHND
jgi:PUA domain protein